jgi:hypothetical protein
VAPRDDGVQLAFGLTRFCCGSFCAGTYTEYVSGSTGLLVRLFAVLSL